jgi:hypothetical protein
MMFLLLFAVFFWVVFHGSWFSRRILSPVIHNLEETWKKRGVEEGFDRVLSVVWLEFYWNCLGKVEGILEICWKLHQNFADFTRTFGEFPLFLTIKPEIVNTYVSYQQSVHKPSENFDDRSDVFSRNFKSKQTMNSSKTHSTSTNSSNFSAKTRTPVKPTSLLIKTSSWASQILSFFQLQNK